MKIESSPQIREKSSNTKFHKIPSSRNRTVPCRQTDVSKISKIWNFF